MLGRLTVFLYGIVCYLIFFATFLYAIAFLGGFGVVKSIDSGPEMPIGQALGINAMLLGLFAVQHSVMARPWFKRAWTRLIPPVAERSTYVLFSSLAMALLFWLWRPMGGGVWEVHDPAGRLAIWTVYALGWLLLLVATFLIDHFGETGTRLASAAIAFVRWHRAWMAARRRRAGSPLMLPWSRLAAWVGHCHHFRR